MKNYKIELHAHNYEESCDSWLSGTELIDAVKAENYDGILITNHYDKTIMGGMIYKRPCKQHDKSNKNCLSCPILDETINDSIIKQAIQLMYESRKKIQEYAEKVGIKVYFGIEWENPITEAVPQMIHLLLLGQTIEEFVKNPPPVYTTIDELLSWKKKTNSTVILNHCNRFEKSCNEYMFCDNDELIDRYEVYNSKNCQYKDTDNDITDFIISRIGKDRYDKAIHLSGGDIHEVNHLGKSGIVLNELPDNERGLQQILLERKYRLINEK